MPWYLPATPWNVPTSSTCGWCLPAPAAPAAVAGNAKEVTSPPASAAAANPDMITRRTPRVPGLTVAPSAHRRIDGKTIRRPRTGRQMLLTGFHHIDAQNPMAPHQELARPLPRYQGWPPMFTSTEVVYGVTGTEVTAAAGG